MEEPRTEEEPAEAIEFSIPLQKLKFDAHVTGVYAQVVVEQEFNNENDVPVEAIYVFPLPENASVAGCSMTIGDKKVEAELKGKEQAKQEYEDAVDAGHHASLLEQKRPNIFTISVGGIEPGEDVKITTTYNQRVSWQHNGGRFTIPLVVAPRFIPGLPTGVKTGGGWADDTREVPDASQITPIVLKEGVDYTADVHVILSPGFPCSVTSPSHEMIEALVSGTNGSESRFDCIELDIEEADVAKPVELTVTGLVPDRDFILCYETKSSNVEASIHTSTFEEEEYITIDVIPPGTAEPKAKDVVFCLDISGSMAGPKLEGLKVVAEKAVRLLADENPDNRVAIVAFESSIHPMHALAPVDDSTYEAIQRLHDEGGTMAGAAIDHCMNSFPESDREQYILLVSDGQTEDEWATITEGVRVVAMGIGSATNMEYLNEIARETGGMSLAVYPGEDYDRVAATLVGYLAGPVLKNIGMEIDGKPVKDVLGIKDAYANMPASLVVKTDKMPDSIQLIGVDCWGFDTCVALDMDNVCESAIAHQIWAREKLRDRELSAEELVEISLEYGVLCGKTAFVAVSLKDVPGEKPQRVEVPVALPATWEYDKVSGEVPMGGRRMFHSAVARRVYTGPSGQSVSGQALFESADQITSSILPLLDKTLSGDDSSESQSSDSAGNSSASYSTSTTGASPSIAYDHVVDELESLIVSLEGGYGDRDDQEAWWKTLLEKMDEKAVEQWSILQVAKAYYLLLKLRTFGFSVSKDFIKDLSTEPDESDVEAHEWWEKAQQVLGVVTVAH